MACRLWTSAQTRVCASLFPQQAQEVKFRDLVLGHIATRTSCRQHKKPNHLLLHSGGPGFNLCTLRPEPSRSLHTCIHIHIHMPIYLCTRVIMSLYIFIYIYIHVEVCVHIYIYVYIHAHQHVSQYRPVHPQIQVIGPVLRLRHNLYVRTLLVDKLRGEASNPNSPKG